MTDRQDEGRTRPGATEEAHLSFIALANERAEIYAEVDGFYVWRPEKRGAALEAHHLRWIAGELDRLNAPRLAQIDLLAEIERTNGNG